MTRCCSPQSDTRSLSVSAVDQGLRWEGFPGDASCAAIVVRMFVSREEGTMPESTGTCPSCQTKRLIDRSFPHGGSGHAHGHVPRGTGDMIRAAAADGFQCRCA